MLKPDQIPDEAVEAAARAACEDRGYDWDEYKNFRPAFRRIARAAIAAALGAWPGAHVHEWQRPWLGGMSGTDIILPLPTEAAD